MNTNPTYRPVDQTFPTTHLPHAERPAEARRTPEEVAADRRALVRTTTDARIAKAGCTRPASEVAGIIDELCELHGLVLGSPVLDHEGDIRLVEAGDPFDTPLFWVNPITGEVI
jgi:hypothetical protein